MDSVHISCNRVQKLTLHIPSQQYEGYDSNLFQR